MIAARARGLMIITDTPYKACRWRMRRRDTSADATGRSRGPAQTPNRAANPAPIPHVFSRIYKHSINRATAAGGRQIEKHHEVARLADWQFRLLRTSS